MTTNQRTIKPFLFLLGLNVLGSIFHVLAKMITRPCLHGCSRFFVLTYRRFRIFTVLLGVLSLVSFALVFHRMARKKSYKSLAYQIGVAITNKSNTTLNKVNLGDIKENITNSNAACKLPVLDPFHASVIHFVKDLGKLHCSGVSYSSFENNVLRVEGKDVVSAEYRKIERTSRNDFGVVLSDPVNVQSTGGGRVAAEIPKGKQNMYFLRTKCFLCEINGSFNKQDVKGKRNVIA